MAKYLTWPTTSWSLRITSTHHLWTIPVFLRAYLRSSRTDHEMMSGDVMVRCFVLSCVVITTHVILSRWLTPISIGGGDSCGGTTDDGDGQNLEGRTQEQYLNVNLSHVLWKDITMSFFTILHRLNTPPSVYIARLLWRWWVLNALVFFGVLLPATNLYVKHFL